MGGDDPGDGDGLVLDQLHLAQPFLLHVLDGFSGASGYHVLDTQTVCTAAGDQEFEVHEVA